jgi:hypothetical protein
LDHQLTVKQRFERERKKQRYYQRRNRQASQSHTKTRIAKLKSLGIDPDRIKTCLSSPTT